MKSDGLVGLTFFRNRDLIHSVASGVTARMGGSIRGRGEHCLRKKIQRTPSWLVFGLDRTLILGTWPSLWMGTARWAQKRGLPRIEGHRRGVTSVRSIVEEASRMGLQQLTLFCFSSENGNARLAN